MHMEAAGRVSEQAGIAPRPGIYFAMVDGEGVVMDIVADRYYGLTAEAAQVWAAIVGADGSAANDETVADALAAWRDSNLIVSAEDARAEGQLPVSKGTRAPAKVGLPGKDIRAARRSARVFAALVFELLRTRLLVKRRGLGFTLRYVQQIRARDGVASRRDELLSILHT